LLVNSAILADFSMLDAGFSIFVGKKWALVFLLQIAPDYDIKIANGGWKTLF